MSVFKDLVHFFDKKDGKLVFRVQCQAFNCSRIFELKNPHAVLPDVPVCPVCEQRFNQGIKEWVHSHTGKTKGNYHLIDGYSKE